VAESNKASSVPRSARPSGPEVRSGESHGVVSSQSTADRETSANEESPLKGDQTRDHGSDQDPDVAPTGVEAEDIESVTPTPGVLHTGAQTVIRDGVQVLTDRPERGDDPLPGRFIRT